MDCQMPELDGFEAARQIRSAESTPASGQAQLRRVPIVALTANAVKGDRERCLEAGMDAYLSKPVDATALLSAIESLIHQYDRVGVREPTVDTPAETEFTAGPIAFAELIERCVNNERVVARVLDKFCVGAPRQLEQIAEAMQVGNAEQLSQAAHFLKGMAANIGAHAVAKLAGSFESSAPADQSARTAFEQLTTAVAQAQAAGRQWLTARRPSGSSQ
jgi:CheY-like chemotaxis protein